MACLFIIKVIVFRGLFFGENITKLVFEMFRASLFKISQELSFLSSLFIVDSIDSRLEDSKNMLMSSAKRKFFSLVEMLGKSFM